jgi:hypothetical protein
MPSKPRSLAGIVRHRAAADAEYNRARRDPAAAAIYRSARWAAVRVQVLRDEPVCRACAAAGRTELATQVDHVVAVRALPDLAYDHANLQPLCTVCHAAKSQVERATPATAGRTSTHLAAKSAQRDSNGGQGRDEGETRRPHPLPINLHPCDLSHDIDQPDGDRRHEGTEDCDPEPFHAGRIAERHSPGEGGTSISHASRPESGTRGTSQFSRVSHFGPHRPPRHGRPASGGCLSER